MGNQSADLVKEPVNTFKLLQVKIFVFPTIKAEPKVVLSTTLHRQQATNGTYYPLFTLQPQLQSLPTNYC